jgi:hypothetical protein
MTRLQMWTLAQLRRCVREERARTTRVCRVPVSARTLAALKAKHAAFSTNDALTAELAAVLDTPAAAIVLNMRGRSATSPAATYTGNATGLVVAMPPTAARLRALLQTTPLPALDVNALLHVYGRGKLPVRVANWVSFLSDPVSLAVRGDGEAADGCHTVPVWHHPVQRDVGKTGHLLEALHFVVVPARDNDGVDLVASLLPLELHVLLVHFASSASS